MKLLTLSLLQDTMKYHKYEGVELNAHFEKFENETIFFLKRRNEPTNYCVYQVQDQTQSAITFLKGYLNALKHISVS